MKHDVSQLEELFLNYLKETENKIMKHINLKNSNINDNFNNFETKLNNLIQKNESIIETIAQHKIYINKIMELDSFQNKANNIIRSHEYKLKNINDEIDIFKSKYNKIVSDNYQVPGYIGNSCKFKTLSDYLSYNIEEVNKLKKDDTKKDIKDLKAKYDNIMKGMVTLNDNSILRCKQYVDEIQNNIIQYINNKLKEYEENKLENKTEIYKFSNMFEQKFNETNNKFK